jgi:hypothetical protein
MPSSSQSWFGSRVLPSGEMVQQSLACICPRESVEEFCDRIRTTDNPDECPVVADFKAFPRRWIMTVAHLNHIPADCTRTNLKALCNPCHCRDDLQQMSQKIMLKQERNGQLRIDGV